MPGPERRPMNTTSYCMVLTTCDSLEAAQLLGEGLVAGKLAACTQIHQVTSIYSWENEIHTDPEFRLIIKTREARYKDVEVYISEHHSYEVPQVVKVPVNDGLPAYLDWMEENTRS